MSFLSTTVLLLVYLFAQTSCQVITVTINYRSHPPEFKSNILSRYMELGQKLNIDHIIPHEMADYIKKNSTFECTRGPEDSQGDILQTCVLNQKDGDKDKLQINYLFKDSSRNGDATDSNPTERCKYGEQITLVRIGKRTSQNQSRRSTSSELKLDVKVVTDAKSISSKKLHDVLEDDSVCRSYRLSRSSDGYINPDTIDKTLGEMYDNISRGLSLSESHSHSVEKYERKLRTVWSWNWAWTAFKQALVDLGHYVVKKVVGIVGKAVVDTVVGKILKPAKSLIVDYIYEPIMENVVRPTIKIVKAIGKKIGEFVKSVVDKAVEIGKKVKKVFIDTVEMIVPDTYKLIPRRISRGRNRLPSSINM